MAGQSYVIPNEALADRIPPPMGTVVPIVPHMVGADTCAHDHLVQFYEGDDVLLASVTTFIGDALRDDRPGVVVATAEHLAEIERRLLASGLDVTRAIRSGSFVTLDAAETLARFMVDRLPDRELFVRTIEPILTSVTARHGHAHVFGEMVAVLVEEGNYPAAIALEDLWPVERVAGESVVFAAVRVSDEPWRRRRADRRVRHGDRGAYARHSGRELLGAGYRR
ncbi:MAG TPA: MEDS domain-containing protein [Thermomicrobiales bacterium]|nr:MEDS domain-containing protein [Thermomicrobiales bacterium]